MRLRQLTVRNVRGVTDRTVDLTTDGSPTGVVIVEGPNESGKSTLAFAFDLLLRARSSAGTAATRSLRTAGSDAAPQVEAELEIGGQRMVYTKQYLKGATTALRLLDPDGNPTGEVLGGDEAHQRVAQLLDEHLDQDLWQSLLLRQGGGPDAPDLDSKSGLTSLLGDLGDVGAIGAREAEVLERAEQEYHRYFTARAGTETGELKAAREQLGEHEARFQAVTARYRALTDDITEVARLRSTLPGLRATAQRASAQAEQLRAQLERIQDLRARVEQRRMDTELAGSRLQAAHESRHHRAQLRTELHRLADEEEQVAAGLEDAARDEQDAATHARERTERRDDTQLEATAATARRQLAQDDLDHLRLRREVTVLRDRFDQADAADARARAAEARRDANRVDPDAIERIRTASNQLAVARAALEAAVPHLRITARDELALQVGEEQATLGAGEERDWSITELLSIRLDDLVDLELRPGDSIDASRDAAGTARTTLDEELAAVGAPDVRTAEAAAAARAVAVEELGRAGAERDAILGGSTLDVRRGQVQDAERRLTAYLDARRSEAPLPEDEAFAAQRLEEAKQSEAAAVEELSAANADFTVAKEQLERYRQATLGRSDALRTIRKDRARLQQQLDAARGEESDEALEERFDRLEGEATRATDALATAQQELDARDADGLEELAENAALVASGAQDELHRNEQTARDLETSIRALGAEGLGEQRADAEAALQRSRSALAGVERRAAAAKRLVTVLRAQRATAQARYAAPLRERIVGYGRLLYGADFDVELDGRLAISRRRASGLWLEVSALSIGAQEQLALLSRLACAALLADKGGVLLIDDALGNTDPERLERLGAIIRSAGQHGQIVIFTCYPQRYEHVGGAKRIAVRRDPAAAAVTAGAGVAIPVEPADDAQETLTCERCGREWSRTVTRGRKPSRCDTCRDSG